MYAALCCCGRDFIYKWIYIFRTQNASYLVCVLLVEVTALPRKSAGASTGSSMCLCSSRRNTWLDSVGKPAANNSLFLADEIVALKRLKMEKEKEGFPITSLREINTILKAQHLNIVTVRVRPATFHFQRFLFL